ncbi:molybdopterin-dependent oxidoreductase [Pseudonocardia endophytica]|uniref:DMSO/TMAO reductase YedYZ molybdopterin-dependent catalytic subunit n=1 Tax=Pseudonocardia endophytica TaxID=401976 RepID=A0A4R1HS51_PSEEN|nr:molybdopterin-dependent oxidoreductase [Pseudonocardia endophytica]TCK20192.1 DMSO/TMAO reductase YedYZ molybdopterin-dependent catalytic subunit [Pseudonocardia endophytica]
MSAPAASRSTTRPVPAGTRCGLSLLSAAAGIGAGHLFGGLVSPSSAPVLAVADRVVGTVPTALTEFAIATFGAADKIVLVAGVLAVLTAAALVAGALSRRDERPGTAVLTVLGGIGVVAVITGPAFGPLDLLAPAVSLIVATWLWRRLYRLARRAARAAGPPATDPPGPATDPPGPATDPTGLATDPPGPATGSPADRSAASPSATDRPPATGRPAVTSRRRLLQASAAAGAGAVAAGAAGTALGAGISAAGGTTGSQATVTARLAAARVRRAPALPAGADLGLPGVTPFVTANPDFYRIDTALRVPSLRAEDWSLRVHGRVARELEISFDELMSRPLVERRVTMTCVSNEVGGSLASTALFVGVELRDLLLEAGPDVGADQLLSTSTDGWTAGTPTGVVLEPGRGALLAVGMNGEALPREHGFPVRMVVPGLYGYVSATKWLADLELTTFAGRSSYWADRGWGVLGPIKTGSRIDVPAAYGDVAAGRVVVAGTAWSQPRGISRVEVRVDDGPWVDAELGAADSGDAWRMWRAVVDMAPGGRNVVCRATDGDGRTQTAQEAPVLPDGATGWPSRRVVAR